MESADQYHQWVKSILYRCYRCTCLKSIYRRTIDEGTKDYTIDSTPKDLTQTNHTLFPLPFIVDESLISIDCANRGVYIDR